ncbi:MAG: phosphatidylinositol kinase [Cycloclasticus sp.]|nr:MAG: phosphatidylinositol kinase [Cycloclasticus sp.]
MIKEYLTNHIATNKQLQIASGLSDRQVLREMKKLGNSVVKITSGKSPRYALVVNAFGVGDSINLWEVDEHGKHSCIAVIRPLMVGGYFVEKRTGGSNLLLGESKNGLYDDMPYFLRDMAPQGFLGRKIAQEIATRDPAFPTNPDLWSNHHIGQYLLSNNDDALGNLKFGESANLRLNHSFRCSTIKDYPKLAEQVMSEGAPMSSAGGEQPKFTTFCTESQADVIVKFSPKGDDANAKRWRDVLISEHYANEVLNKGATTASQTRLIEQGERLYLESIRFDRVGEDGRCSMLSLKSVDAEFVGLGENWVNCLTNLKDNNLLSEQDVLNGKYLWLFGKLINNTDMHLGNMSLSIHGDVFSLLPIYDMCSMGFAPKKNGEVQPFSYVKPDLPEVGFTQRQLKSVETLVDQYWHLILKDERISDEFRSFLMLLLSADTQESIF